MNNSNIKNDKEEFDELKSLLLEDEIDAYTLFEEKLKKLDFETQDAKTQSIIAKYLLQIIEKTSSDDAARLSKSLQSVISPAISKEIENNKDTMIDTLYPIMGGMISKYVSQAIKEIMESINKKIESGLSFERVKRKAKSKLTGVSETELLLHESNDAVISSMFVMHKETSLLIAEAHLENKEIDDAHMVASMAAAIKNFINDWIQRNDTNNEIQLLSYGDSTLYIESAGSVFIVAFLDTEPEHEQRIKINTFFASIVKKYASFFQTFDGDDSANEVLTLSMDMEDYIYASQPVIKDKKKNPAKYIFIFLALLLFGYGIYVFNQWYIEHSLENTVLSQTGEKIDISTKDGHLMLEGQVVSTDVIYEIEKIMKRHSKEAIVNHLTVPMTYLDARFKSVESLGDGSFDDVQNKLAFLERNFEKTVNGLQEKIVGLESQVEGSKVYLSKLLKGTTDEITMLKEEKLALKKVLEVKSEIVKRLDSTFSDEVYYNLEHHSLDFRKLTLFSAGETVYEPKAMQKLTKVFKKYLEILVEYKEYLNAITIAGHSDSAGLEDENIALSEKRALGIQSYLEKLKMVEQYNMQKYMKTIAYGSSKVISVNNIEDKNASRRIEIRFSLKDEEILNKLGKMIND